MGVSTTPRRWERAPDRVGEDAIEVGERQHAAEDGAHDDGAPGELAHAVAAPAIDAAVPLTLDLLGRAGEALDG